MAVQLVTDEKIAETSSKGNQEKWYDNARDYWYKLDQFGYEALAETFISLLLEKSNIETKTPFTFVRYYMEKLIVHGRERNGCYSRNFLLPGQTLVTVNRLLSNHLGVPLKEKLVRLPSDRQRIAYLADSVAGCTGLMDFPRYITMLFEIDSLFCNDDRHLNNIAVIEQAGIYSYCPVFDNAAGLLSNTQISQMDISPKALVAVLQARPFRTTFTRQMNTARRLYGKQLMTPRFGPAELRSLLLPLLEHYAPRDRGLIAERVIYCIVSRAAFL